MLPGFVKKSTKTLHAYGARAPTAGASLQHCLPFVTLKPGSGASPLDFSAGGILTAKPLRRAVGPAQQPSAMRKQHTRPGRLDRLWLWL